MNTPLVMDTPKTLKIRSGCKGGGKGALVQEDMSATLSCNNDQTLFEPRVYGICSDKSNSMLSDNPRSGIYEAGSSRTIDANGGNPGCNQGGMAVVETAPAYSASKSSFFTTAERSWPALLWRLITRIRHLSMTVRVWSSSCAALHLLSVPGYKAFLTGGAKVWEWRIRLTRKLLSGRKSGKRTAK
jgi:hypothetical protein